ncbi:GDP-mannose 4,6-dehydratase [Mycobacterium intracellulare]|uniref:GDP-mannose 4,6-dehydratase n=1 Tax=Mycobacterium intracellulare TaxID=1767 RepID=UPI0022B76153|nr:GDP-mannose 4,6-dehydratase [Mycobacterium intracellulare]
MVETLESVAVGTINLLDAIRFLDKSIRFYSAGSSECFGDTTGGAVNEQTPFRPGRPSGPNPGGFSAGDYTDVGRYRDLRFPCRRAPRDP